MPYWLLVAAGLGIFLGCVGKSAQFPLHVWLPDAMEGPTPVSALIHAATMVAAGVYLVGRVYPLFTPESRLVIAYTGGITLFVAATVAIVMTDIKKVLAYSTVSQLGYMMLALGVGGWVAGLFHLLTHAFFKALLFLCSGSVIYGCHHEQDMTRMGGLYPKMKTTAITMLIGVLAIIGTPFFTGWYSKDAILAQALGFMRVHPEHFLLFLLPLVTAGITCFYMFRMWFMTFTGEPRDAHVYEHAHESPRTMTVPLIVLAVCSIAVAWGWPLWDAEASLLGAELHHAQPHSIFAEFGLLAEHGETWEGGAIKAIDQSERYFAAVYHSYAEALAFVAGALGLVFAALIYYYRRLDPAEATEQFPALHRFLWNKWYFDELYSAILVRPALVVARWCRNIDVWGIDGTVDAAAEATVRVSKWSGRFDLGIVDGLVNLTADVIYAVGARLRRVQTGYLRSYVLFLVLAAIGIFAVVSYVLVALARAAE
jgi:NADH-quinone oxidoreductase subunit L